MTLSLETLVASGSAQSIGETHGDRYAGDIAAFAQERVAHAGDAQWIGVSANRADVLALAHDCLDAHRDYSPSLVAELDALADAAELSSAEALIGSGFTDFIDTAHAVLGKKRPAPTRADNCTAMIVPAARTQGGSALFAQTWDMHESATEHVFVLDGRPTDGPRFLTFTSRGCLGMIGMNAAGITIGINNLSGADGQIGVSWNFVVREVLAQRDFASAVAAVERAELAGAHNYLLVGPNGEGVNIEATATTRCVTELADRPLVHTNHCLADSTRACERERLPASRRSSTQRLARAEALLADKEVIGIDDLAAITRDTDAICYPPSPLFGMTTCGAVLADPAKRTLWALRGRPSEQSYQSFTFE